MEARMTRLRTTDAAQVRVCPPLPPDLWDEVMRQTGNSIEGFVTQVRLARVQKHVAGPLLPSHGGVCTLNLRDVAMYQCCKNREFQNVYMLDTGRITGVCCHSGFRALRIYEQYNQAVIKLPRSTMWHKAHSIVYWVPPQNKMLVRVGLRVACSEDELTDDDLRRVEQYGCKSLASFHLSAKSLMEASAPVTQQLAGRHHTSSSNHLHVFASIVRALTAPANKHIHHLDLDLDNVSDISFDGLMAPMATLLTHFTLRSLSVDVAPLLRYADNLVMLSLHDTTIGADAVRELMQLYIRWNRHHTGVRGVHMHQIRSNVRMWYTEIAYVVVALGLVQNMDVVGHYEEIEHGLIARTGTTKLWFTCSKPDGCNVRMFEDARDIATFEAQVVAEIRLADIDADSFVTHFVDAFGIVHSPIESQSPPPPVPPPVAPPVAPPVPPPAAPPAAPPGRYSDAGREQVRHMWQWYPSVCNSCGTVWQTNCVTISWRQSAVSSCLHNKRKCQSRPEFARMMNGEKFMTMSHWLTPSPEEVVQAEAKNLIVAVDPSSHPESIKYTYFHPNGTSKRPVSE